MFSFIKSHLKQKTVVFFSSCSQVRYVNQVFCGLQPGIPLLALHGKIKQQKRTHIYFDFLRRPSAVLFATDVAARGLDFPDVDWVFQANAPEDSDLYIHRVGRTARNNRKGSSLLCVLPSEEEGCSKMLEAASIPIKKLSINPAKTVTVTKRAASIVASDVECNRLAKKAFVSYLRSTMLMPNKDIFKIKEVDVRGFAASLGLATVPSTKFMKTATSEEGGKEGEADEGREENREKKNKSRKLERLKQQIAEEKLEKLQRKGKKLPEAAAAKGGANSDDDEDPLMVVKAKHNWSEEDNAAEAAAAALAAAESQKAGGGFDSSKIIAKRPKEKELIVRADGSSGINKKATFDDDGMMIDDTVKLVDVDVAMAGSSAQTLEDENNVFMDKIKERVKASRAKDVEEEKIRLKLKRRRDKPDKEEDSDDEGDAGVQLGSYEEEEEEEDDRRSLAPSRSGSRPGGTTARTSTTSRSTTPTATSSPRTGRCLRDGVPFAVLRFRRLAHWETGGD